MKTNTILCGDIREIARELPDQSAHCIVTSPPYFGLRDYQTAEWEGGDPECDHIERTGTTRGGPASTITGGQDIKPHEHQYRQTCPKCGAIRVDKQIGLEETPEAYVETMVGIFRELRRVLRDDGTVWLNLGDSYASAWASGRRSLIGQPGRTNRRINIGNGLKEKDLCGIPWRVALALQADGYYLRSDIIWSKPNPMPESVTDRPTKAHEYIFLLSKSERYYYDADAVKEPVTHSSLERAKYPLDSKNSGYRNDARTGTSFEKTRNGATMGEAGFVNPAGRNRRTVWEISTRPFVGAHFAVFPPDLIRPCILAGCPPGGIVLDPFIGSGTVAEVAIETGRNWLGVELNPEYIELAKKRIAKARPALLAPCGNGYEPTVKQLEIAIASD